MQQVGSGEIRGCAQPADPALFCIKAYPRRLHAGERGITFTTTVAPDPRFSAPHEARWYFTQRAAIPATVTNLQP